MSRMEIDQVTGVETTGHEWDGIKELNKPLPKWWLWTFYATIVWAIGYWVLYPAWPTFRDYSRGMLGYSQRATVAQEVTDALAEQARFRQALAATPLEQVKSDPELLRFAMAAGAAAFAANCAPCHGRGAQGSTGYPNLNDDDWLWGGSISQIEGTVRFGIRSGHAQARDSQMPKFGVDKLLEPKQIDDVAEFVLSLSGKGSNPEAARRGQPIYAEQCVACHGEKGAGNRDLGAPSLVDPLWLYGDTKAAIVESIRTGRGGVMPSWEGRLDPITIKALALYVHSLGGGQ